MYHSKTLSVWQKFLRLMGFVRYEDFMRCRDALSKVGQDHEDDQWVMEILDEATYICDYYYVTSSYPDPTKYGFKIGILEKLQQKADKRRFQK